ncbi:hypothetical protein E2C01_067282 [Portunus trituberculatus]|uniref:Uncharacterized protein n=1 Tax=Portunus trituberculatus TaxID=210409 RepID=A0A5B7HTC3_PORTR|nr:hypothetical protein [Portunus trituberculatus]
MVLLRNDTYMLNGSAEPSPATPNASVAEPHSTQTRREGVLHRAVGCPWCVDRQQHCDKEINPPSSRTEVL